MSVRDFALLDELSGTVAGYDSFETHGVQWLVDDTNPAWAQVRSEAIQAALLKGRDYAAALGGTVVSVEHVADAGLLGGDPSADRASRSSAVHTFGAAGGLAARGDGGPSLDPAPQTLSAVIEARFVATVSVLPT